MLCIVSFVVLCFLSIAVAYVHLESEPLEISSGLTFTRTIDRLPGSFDLTFDGNHCSSQDEFGDNNCHYDWGEDITGGYKVTVDQRIDTGDKMEGHFKIDGVIPYSFSCPLCGEDCVLTVPVVKFSYTIPLPPCPVSPHTAQTLIEYQLQDNSMTDGIPVHLEGTVKISKASGDELAEFSISAHVK